jgi:hypothetical protein
MAGHPGRDETLRKIKELYQWPKMNQWITDYVKGCATCQQNKIQTHKRKTPPFGITITPDMKPFSQIALDLITGLPQVNGKNTILTIVDHGCSRAVAFIPCMTNITGPRMLQGGSLHPLRDKHYWTRNSATILTKHLPMVWPPIKGHL